MIKATVSKHSFRETLWWKFSRIRGFWNGEF